MGKMKVEFSESAKNDPNCEIRLGVASWADGNNAVKSVKYAWPDKNGKVARGGEIPVKALRQAYEFAIQKGYIKS